MLSWPFAGGLVFIAIKALPAAAGDRVLVALDGNLVEELALAVDHNETVTVPIPGRL